MTPAEGIPKLRDLNARLASLLTQDEMGNAHWLMAVAQTVEEMAEIVDPKGGSR